MNCTLRVILLLIIAFNSVALADDDDEQTPKQQTPSVSGQVLITLSDKAQQQSGLKTDKLKSVEHHAELTAYGKVLSIQPLIELRHRYLTALTERDSANAKFKQAEQQINRQQTLYSAGITAKRQLEDQQAQWHIDKSQLQAIAFQDQLIKQNAQLTWGNTLTTWAFAKETPKINALLSGQAQLLQITLPSNQQLDDDVKKIMVAASGLREQAQDAQFISAAPQTENHQGNSYFFLTRAKNLSIGMTVTAWIAQNEQRITGVMIPKSALLWSMDQAFVYIKVDKEQFSRRLLENYQITEQGYFVSTGLKPDEEIVTTGGQMLLSEELRAQIPDED